jgi:RimJ/RimL family protein N-acetyltransferase
VRAIDRPRLETDRLVLTPMTIDDMDAYVGLHSDPDVIAFLGEMDQALAIARLEKDGRQWETFGYGLFKLTARDDGRFLGRVGLRYWPQFDETEVGWTLRRREWGRGYATEAAVVLADWGFRTVPVPYLTACIEPRNERSIAVAERLGMTPLRHDVLNGIPAIGGSVVDGIRCVIYAVRREDWASATRTGRRHRDSRSE